MTKAIAIVDDDDGERRSTASLLESAGYCVQAFASAAAFLAARLPKSPDCVVVDMRMPGASGLELLRAVMRRDDRPCVLVTSGDVDVSLAVEAMKLGAADFLERPYPPTALLEAIDRACALRDQKRLSAAVERQAAARLALLSERQRQILRGVVGGQPNKIIAYELGLSIRTVESYRAKLIAKLEVRSTAEAIRIAMAAGLDGDGAGFRPLAQLACPASRSAGWLNIKKGRNAGDPFIGRP
jgi:two-component system response regulator FixJ